MILISLKKEFK